MAGQPADFRPIIDSITETLETEFVQHKDLFFRHQEVNEKGISTVKICYDDGDGSFQLPPEQRATMSDRLIANKDIERLARFQNSLSNCVLSCST